MYFHYDNWPFCSYSFTYFSWYFWVYCVYFLYWGLACIHVGYSPCVHASSTLVTSPLQRIFWSVVWQQGHFFAVIQSCWNSSGGKRKWLKLRLRSLAGSIIVLYYVEYSENPLLRWRQGREASCSNLKTPRGICVCSSWFFTLFIVLYCFIAYYLYLFLNISGAHIYACTLNTSRKQLSISTLY